MIRADIKTALKSGALTSDPDIPGLPAGLKISVRTEYASLMSEIRVTIKCAPGEWALIGPAEFDRKRMPEAHRPATPDQPALFTVAAPPRLAKPVPPELPGQDALFGDES